MKGYSEASAIPNSKIPKESALELKNRLCFSDDSNLYPDHLTRRKIMINDENGLKKSKYGVLNDLIMGDINFLLKVINAEYNAYTILDRIRLSDIVEDYKVFENKEVDEELNLLDVLHLFPKDYTSENKTISLHDSVLMDRYSFGRTMNDIMLILQCLPTRKENSGFCTLFDSTVKPSISIKDYFARLSEYFLCSPSLFVLMLIYIKRIIDNNPSYIFDLKSAHRFMLATLVISVKLYDDKFLPNAHYAHVGGVSESELSRLEVDALLLMDFRLKVTIEEFVKFSYSLRLLGEVIKKYGIAPEDSNTNMNSSNSE
ncbi:cyclin 6 pcl7 [Cryptosporidium sp. chipmunk genotype I]|uniref:cyclin 6 pcl7 n=1 Tax=Cryptosporidium sp. chipmunk genotype I TaxID=1280935 RepID=UPI00351A327E|nr:cyclin 6 pcl7 [Cryptosporidium sp. chipmunk genotype I]